MLTENLPKIPQFFCEICKTNSGNKKDYNKHLLTAKHKKNEFLTKTGISLTENPLVEENHDHECSYCNKVYKSRVGLWYHKKKCLGIKSPVSKNSNENQYNQLLEQDQDSEPQEAITSDMFMEFIKHSKEMQTFMAEQQKEFQSAILERTEKLQDSIIELSKNNNSTTINTTNNTFNLNVFLNEHCKDALNINQFLESLQLTVEDLETTGRLGYVLGISRILINKLRELDVYSRPLHCTDYKRETVYIRDQDKWEKENTKAKLHNMIRQVEKKNLKMLSAWQQENPEFREVATPKNDEFVKISLNSIGEYTHEGIEKQDEKIMRNVLKEVILDKGKV